MHIGKYNVIPGLLITHQGCSDRYTIRLYNNFTWQRLSASSENGQVKTLINTDDSVYCCDQQGSDCSHSYWWK